MADVVPNGRIARNALLLAAAAAGCGWLIYSWAVNKSALADGARGLGRNLKQQFDNAGEWAVERVQNLTAAQQPPRVRPRKIAVDEPMAGYGA